MMVNKEEGQAGVVKKSSISSASKIEVVGSNDNDDDDNNHHQSYKEAQNDLNKCRHVLHTRMNALLTLSISELKWTANCKIL